MFQSATRGFSVLPALLFAVILGLVVGALQNLGSLQLDKNALTAQAITSFVPTPRPTSPPASSNTTSPTPSEGTQANTSANPATPATAPAGAEQEQCNAGDRYEINAAGQTTNGQYHDREIQPTWSCSQGGASAEAIAACQAANPTCEVLYCDPEGDKCKTLSFKPGQSELFARAIGANTLPEFGKNLKQTELASLLANMTPEQRQQTIPNLGLERNIVDGAFQELTAASQQEIARNGSQIDSLQEYLDQCARAGNASCNDVDLDQAITEQQALQERNRQLEEQMRNLSSAQEALTPGGGGESVPGAICTPAGASHSCVPNPDLPLDQQDRVVKDLRDKGYNCVNTGDGYYCDKTTPPGIRPEGPCPDGSIMRADQTCPDYSRVCSIRCQPGQTVDAQCRCVGTQRPPNTFPDPRTQQQPRPNQQNPLSSLLNSLGKMLGGGGAGAGGGGSAPPRPPAQACQTDSNAYAQQQQQYQQQLQQYNYQLQQYNYQQQLNQYNQQYYGQNQQNYGYASPPPAQPQPCTPSTGGQCASQPPQPPASSCTVGYWRPNYNGVCISNWQCVPNAANSQTPTATLSCQPQVADVGMTLTISYSCSAGVASGSGFTATGQSGSAVAVVGNPPAGANTATYALTCTSDGPPSPGAPGGQGKTAGAQCSIQIARPSIILVANPKTVAKDGISLLGWVTSGMQSCVVSSPDQADFTARNSSNTSVNGAATTSPVASQSRFLLHCQTVAGGVKDATTTVSVR